MCGFNHLFRRQEKWFASPLNCLWDMLNDDMAFVCECHAKCSVDNHPIFFKSTDMFFVIVPQYWPKAGFFKIFQGFKCVHNWQKSLLQSSHEILVVLGIFSFTGTAFWTFLSICFWRLVLLEKATLQHSQKTFLQWTFNLWYLRSLAVWKILVQLSHWWVFSLCFCWKFSTNKK